MHNEKDRRYHTSIATAMLIGTIAIMTATIFMQSIVGNRIFLFGQANAEGNNNTAVTPTNSSRLAAAGNATANAAASLIEGKPQIVISPHSVNAGDRIVVSGSKFSPNATITLTFDDSKNTTTAKSDSSGAFKVIVKTPSNAPNGPYDVKAAENGSGKSATALVTIATTPQNQFQAPKK